MNNKGYTILEALMVTFVIAILATTSFYTFNKQKEKVNFNRSLSTIASMFKEARNAAITSKTAPNGQIPPEGYGVYIDQATQKIIYFANFQAGTGDEKKQYDDGAAGNGADLIIEEHTLNSDTVLEHIMKNIDTQAEVTDELTRLKTSTAKFNVKDVVMIFKPPLATTTMITNNGTPLEINKILLRLVQKENQTVMDEATRRYITISKVGGFPTIKHPDPQDISPATAP